MTQQDNRFDPRRKQLLYRANHRGIKEMDILLGGYASEHVAGMDDTQIDRFEALLEESDRDLLNWFTGQTPPPDHVRSDLFDAILAFQQVRLSTPGKPR